jgi:peptidoglycan/xylan/chitin deacetylase (PgdA/CDA1 family)
MMRLPSPQERAVLVAKPARPMQPTVILTFDDSTVEHYTVAVPLLQQYGFRAVFGVVTTRPFAGWECAHRMRDAGHVLVSHSHTHPRPRQVSNKADRLAAGSATRTAEEELARSVGLLRQRNCVCDGFIYPHGQRASWHPQLLKRHGIRWALRSISDYHGTNLSQVQIDPYAIPRAESFRLAQEGRRKRV